jgi:hypothetical protein
MSGLGDAVMAKAPRGLAEARACSASPLTIAAGSRLDLRSYGGVLGGGLFLKLFTTVGWMYVAANGYVCRYAGDDANETITSLLHVLIGGTNQLVEES